MGELAKDLAGGSPDGMSAPYAYEEYRYTPQQASTKSTWGTGYNNEITYADGCEVYKNAAGAWAVQLKGTQQSVTARNYSYFVGKYIKSSSNIRYAYNAYLYDGSVMIEYYLMSAAKSDRKIVLCLTEPEYTSETEVDGVCRMNL